MEHSPGEWDCEADRAEKTFSRLGSKLTASGDYVLIDPHRRKARGIAMFPRLTIIILLTANDIIRRCICS